MNHTITYKGFFIHFTINGNIGTCTVQHPVTYETFEVKSGKAARILITKIIKKEESNG